MRAIPTVYKGTAFRSRLEADFAATFHSLGWVYEYEPEGFTLSNGMSYLPDFYLPGTRAYIEVKGDHLQRVDKAERFAQDLWDEAPIDEFGERTAHDPRSPLVVLATKNSDTFLTRMCGGPIIDTIALRGSGSRYSIAVMPCPGCQEVSIQPLWAEKCRVCSTVCHPDRWTEAYYGGPPDYESKYPLLRLISAPVEQWQPRPRSSDPFAGLAPKGTT